MTQPSRFSSSHQPVAMSKERPRRLQRVLLVFAFLFLLGVVGAIDALAPAQPNRTHSLPDFSTTRAQGFLPRLDALSQDLNDFEKALERGSRSRSAARVRLQGFLTGRLGLGNERVMLTKQGLLFKSDWQWVTGQGFLATSRSWAGESRAQSGEVIEFPDPRPAILQFLGDCEDIPLILIPLPNKAMLADQGGEMIYNNRDFEHFAEAMRQRGVDVFWPLETMDLSAKAAFLQSDTHWTPQFMQHYAELLAQYLADKNLTDQANPGRYQQAEPLRITQQGDLARMLNLSKDMARFGVETVSIQPVTTAAGKPWQSVGAAEILILGDSYVNIYTDPSMGWGESAGLAPQLSLQIQMDLDVIARNGSAPTQARAALARRPHPLAGKRAVLWIFAIRDLAFGNWRPIAMPASRENDDAQPLATPQNTREITVRAKLITQPGRCDPEATPYENALIHLKFEIVEVLQGHFEGTEILASFQLMADRQLLPVAKLEPGNIYSLTLTDSLPPHTQNWTLIDDTEAYDLDPWWVISHE